MDALDRQRAEALQRVQESSKEGIVRSFAMRRTDRERLLRAGWLQPVIRGWYLLTLDPDQISNQTKSDSTSLWIGHYWSFIHAYLHDRFHDDYCLSAEDSLDLHTDSTLLPKKLIVMVKKSTSSKLDLPHGLGVLIYPESSSYPSTVVKVKSVNAMPIADALCRVTTRYFRTHAVNAELALRIVQPDDLSRVLLQGRHTRAAARLIGAYRFLNDDARAERIKADMLAAGYRVSASNPFEGRAAVLSGIAKITSPVSARLQALWASMRDDVVSIFADEPGMASSEKTDLTKLDDIYPHDAYHSLSIEGYVVTPALIERIVSGQWDVDNYAQDSEQRGAMAVRGYLETYTIVKRNIHAILGGDSPADIIAQHLQHWHRALFSASVQAGIVATIDLAGYRNRSAYIQGSKHVPPAYETVADCMHTFFELLRNEPSSAVRAILGHFVIVFIHPYINGNGLLARFLMNTQLASGGYHWTIIRLAERERYLNALEQASINSDIRPFAEFVREAMSVSSKAYSA